MPVTTSLPVAHRTDPGTARPTSRAASSSASAQGALHRWLSLKAVACHVTGLILVPAFLTAAWWQAQRAASGNTLSYVYVVEWPAFALVVIWSWWQIVHLPPRDDEAAGRADSSWLRWDPASESPQLKAYNSYLAELNRTGRMVRPPRLGRRRAGELPSAVNAGRALGPPASPGAAEARDEPAP